MPPSSLLTPKLINTYYPPTGHQDEARILPHIVFNDPHVPWFREAGRSPWLQGPVDNGTSQSDQHWTEDGHNFTPWLALMVFEKFGTVGKDADAQDDLAFGPDDAKKLGISDFKSYDPAKLPANGAFAMSVGDYLSKVQSRVKYEAGYDDAPEDFTALQSSPEATNVIFPTKAQVLDILKAGSADLTPLKAQKMLAHVRQINTIGFPDAGVEEEGYYSVVISSMTGNLKRISPSTHVVHLVSLEHLDATLNDVKFQSAELPDRIGLVSLFSWIYTCLPASISFPDTMAALGVGAQPLKPPQQTLDDLEAKATGTPAHGSTPAVPPDPIAAALYERLNAGYTIARWRTATGEETVAFNRSPLVPVRTQEVPTPAAGTASRPWPALSMTGKDYLVFDARVGIMDATYASAWSLGKLMAISDSTFNAALMRFRSTIWAEASSAARMQLNGIPEKSAVIATAPTAIKAAHALTPGAFKGAVARIAVPSGQTVTTNLDDPRATSVLQNHIAKSVTDYASIPRLPGDTSDPVLYNGFDGKAGSNSDWELILNWIHDTMYLAAIPAHVLFPEPSHLVNKNPKAAPPDQPSVHPEALRFFHIDHAWIDAYLDGALSCANHLEPEYDFTRLRIKRVFNDFLSQQIAGASQTKFPPVPRYGFIIRSAAVKATPDLRLKVTCWKKLTQADPKYPDETVFPQWVEDVDRDPLVRHTRMDDFSIFSLVDCLPEEICMIRFSQPPHQQRFALGSNPMFDHVKGIVTDVETKMLLNRLYTSKKLAPPFDPKQHEVISQIHKYVWPELPEQIPDQTGFYDWTTRCLRPITIANKVNDQVLAWSNAYPDEKPYTITVSNSSVLGLQLNDPACKST